MRCNNLRMLIRELQKYFAFKPFVVLNIPFLPLLKIFFFHFNAFPKVIQFYHTNVTLQKAKKVSFFKSTAFTF